MSLYRIYFFIFIGVAGEDTAVSSVIHCGHCFFTQLNMTLDYDYEYSGATERIALTPLMERSLVSLVIAVGSYRCGTLVGPAATGKSETIKDFAKVFTS